MESRGNSVAGRKVSNVKASRLNSWCGLSSNRLATVAQWETEKQLERHHIQRRADVSFSDREWKSGQVGLVVTCNIALAAMWRMWRPESKCTSVMDGTVVTFT